MSVSQLYNRPMIALLAISFLALFLLRLFRPNLGVGYYIVAFSSAVAIVTYSILRKSWKDFPPEAAVRSEKSKQINVPFEQICNAIPKVVAKNHWRSIESDANQGHFKVKIGMSIWTYGQIMEISINKASGGFSKISVNCKAPHQLWDHGQDDRMIAKFFGVLEKYVTS